MLHMTSDAETSRRCSRPLTSQTAQYRVLRARVHTAHQLPHLPILYRQDGTYDQDSQALPHHCDTSSRARESPVLQSSAAHATPLHECRGVRVSAEPRFPVRPERTMLEAFPTCLRYALPRSPAPTRFLDFPGKRTCSSAQTDRQINFR